MGGVLNILADNLPHKEAGTWQFPRCPHCDVERPLAAWLATTGYIWERGKCASCGAALPWRHVWVELATALVYALLFYYYGLTVHMLLLSLYMAILILVTVIDLEHRLVLNKVILPSILFAFVASFFTPNLTWMQALVGGLTGFLFFYLVAILYPGGMGAGDVKLAAFVGLITGFPAVVVALVVTMFAGGIVSLFLILTRIRSMRDAIPYGPFLVIGGAFALFWGGPIMDDYMDRDESALIMPLPARDKEALPHLALEEPIDWAEIWSEKGG